MDSKSTSDPCGEKAFDWVISSDLLPLIDSYLLFLIAPLAATPPLTFLLLFSLSPYLAPGRCFRFQNLGSDHLPILLTVPLSIFKKLVGMTLPFTLTLTVLLQRKTRLFFLCCCSLYFSDTKCLLTIWCCGRRLCSFPFWQRRLWRTSTALFVALKPPFFFQQAQCTQVFPLKPAPFCTLFAGLGSTNKSAISLLSDSRSVLSTIFSFTLISGRNCHLSHLLSGYNGSPNTRFSGATTRLMSWPDGGCYLFPQQSLVISLIYRIHSSLFSDRRHTVSSKFFDTQVSSISIEELVLLSHARCLLSRLRCNGHSLLLSSYL